MMSEEEALGRLDPNTADEDALSQLPGIGPALAGRIVKARPYETPDDLLRVPGLGETLLEAILPRLHIPEEPGSELATEAEIALEDELPMEAEEEVQESQPEILQAAVSAEEEREPGEVRERLEHMAGEMEVRLSQAADQAEERLKQMAKRASTAVSSLPAAFDRVETLWLVVGMGVISVILSVVLSLVILGGINRTLDIGRHQAVRDLIARSNEMDRQLEELRGSLDGLNRRLEPLEGLSGRMTSVEDQLQVAQEEVGQAIEQVAAMETNVDELQEEMRGFSESISRFDTFLEGLQTLLDNLRLNQPQPTPSP